MQTRMQMVNGDVGIVLYNGKEPITVIVPQIVDGKIRRIYSILNPDKLHHVPELD